ncbi:chemotaxis protein CheB [Sorangium cellulosum]|uniref:chemotaxis protein CheB n=1 Tax=Sorangium cellulosum TaxID=56 RepID=UPI000A4CD533|nr:chemotaxis protein CheB [Sorangium cellulosum]
MRTKNSSRARRPSSRKKKPATAQVAPNLEARSPVPAAEGAGAPAPRAPVASAPPSYVVGLGSSAGGLEALRILIGGLKSADRMSIVIVQHLAPQHRSRLVEIISHSTSLNVKEVSEGEDLCANTVYVTPPNADVVTDGRALLLRQPQAKVGPKPSVDLFFKSIAEHYGENAIGVILSGTGSDGAQGIRAIKAAGGVTICQTPESAKYDGMPRAAKQTGAVDLELGLEEMANQLSKFNELAKRHDQPDASLRQLGLSHQDPYHSILAFLEKASRVNFAKYKQSTVRRRIERRVIATRCESIEAYADYLRLRPEEGRLLFQDILISVTSFFRDEPSFKALAAAVAERIDKKRTGDSFRAWVVGCATGEEAYSIAILVFEALGKANKQLNVQIFATDIDEQAMSVARKGLYQQASVADIPPRLRSRYFDEQNQSFRVKDYVRDAIVFARHDVAQDPPFLKLDLVSCRNVLIYFNSHLQEHTLRTFHFAMDTQGVLFLGKSESATTVSDLFELTDKNAKIFVRSAKKGDLPRSYSRQEFNRESALITKDRQSTTALDLFTSMVNGFAPDSILIGDDHRVRHVFGGANRYLHFPKGEPTVTIQKLLPADVAHDLGALLHRAQRSGHAARGDQRHAFVIEREERKIQLTVVPLSSDGRTEFIVCFSHAPYDVPRRPVKSPAGGSRLAPEEQLWRLEQELAATREHLQTVIEEHDTASEELQALNEELQSSNEELQSTNEELETTNEELQSANEELTTLNQEINVKSSELLTLNQRLVAIQNAIAYPLLVVDKNLRLTDYNPASRHLFRLSEVDRGQHIRAALAHLSVEPVLDMVGASFQERRPMRHQIEVLDRHFEASIQLIEGSKGEVDGAVLSFVDNTELVHALTQSRVSRERLSAILDNTPALVTMKDSIGAYVYVNQRFCGVLGRSEKEVLGRTDEELFGPKAGSAMRERDFEVLKARSPMWIEESLHVGGKPRYWLSSKFPLLDDRRNAQSVCTIALDITERVLQEQHLKVFKKVVSASNAGLAILESDQGQHRVTFASNEFADKIGRNAPELHGLPLDELLEIVLSGAESPRIAELSEAARQSPLASFTINLAEKAGGELWIELRTATISFGGEEPSYLILLIFDVTQRVQAQRLILSQQEELSRFSKLASLGEIAAGISHEINTPLNVITTKTDLLKRLAERGQLEKERLARIAVEVDGMVENITNVISGLKSITRMESEKLRPHNVQELVREAVRVSGFRLQQASVHLSFDLPREDLIIDCYPVQIVQILINLLNNAVDAISSLRERWIRIEARSSDELVYVRVIDSGKGIDPALAEKIMTPFFTTKKEEHGTGLGLSLSRNIAQHHDGDLRLVMEHKNTCFELELPRKQI